MFLQYGINEHGELVYIDQVGRGATGLHCPYCGGLLLAKKGMIKVHHFAHIGETCRQVNRGEFEFEINLPAYERFDLNIRPKDLELITAFHQNSKPFSRDELEYLERIDLLKYNPYNRKLRYNYELSRKGKIPFGELSLELFDKFQNPLFHKKHDEMMGHARRQRHNGFLEYFADCLTDLRLYRAQWRRILSCTLYFLKVHNSPMDNLYKIGVTTRDVAARVAEIRQDLIPVFGQVDLEVLGTWEHRGNVELYFKHRYQQQQYPIGALTEYFVFPDVKPVLSYDLRRMKPKVLTSLEQEILDGLPSELERQIADEAADKATAEARLRKRLSIKEGMKRASEAGQHVGRPRGRAAPEQFLQTAEAKRVLAVIEQYNGSLPSVREIGRLANVAPNTVQKVKRALT